VSYVKSPLRYPGGKSRAVDFLAEYLPPFDEFREVFFGGGSFGFHCVQRFPDKKFAASDLNYELFCFWNQLKENPNGLVAGVQDLFDKYKSSTKAIAGKQLFELLVNRRNENETELQRAVDFFVLNRITFSGVVDSGGYSQGSFDGRFTQTSIDRLLKAHKVVQRFDFYCEDFSFLIERKGKNVFLFLDPPYHAATKSKLYGRNGILHTEFEHERLFNLLKKSKHKWLVTYDNSSFIRELYKDFYQLDWRLQYGMTNAKSADGNELLIANYDLKAMAKENARTLSPISDR
jgi:DNA adenine methylase